MDIRSHLNFLGLAQAKNFKPEHLTADPVNPAVGQMWLNISEHVFKGFNGTDIIEFGTPDDFQNMVNVLTNVLDSVGLNANGTYSADVNSNFLRNATSVKNALFLLDTILNDTRVKFAGSYFLYVSTDPLLVHAIVHELGCKYCTVTIVDENDYVIIPDSIHYDSDNQLSVGFDIPINCKVIIQGKHS